MYDRHFVARKFEYIIQAEAARRAVSKARQPQSSELARPAFGWRVTSLLRRRTGLSPVAEGYSSEEGSSTPRGREAYHKKVRTDMIRRMDAPPRPVNPSGWISEGLTSPLRRLSSKLGSGGGQEKGQSTEQSRSPIQIEPPTDLTSSPIAEKDIHAPGGNPQTSPITYVPSRRPVPSTDAMNTSHSPIAPGSNWPAACQFVHLLEN